MNTYLFSRARKILLNDWVEQRAVTANNMYFIVRNEKGTVYNVSVGYCLKDRQIGNDCFFSYTCDCPFMSVAGISKQLMCSHIFAVIGHLIGIRRRDNRENQMSSLRDS